jgi:uncharacterized RmlC-like cupin family protein
LTPNC